MEVETETIRFEEEFIFNSRGFKLYTCKWLPANTEPKALIFLCHGYGVECSFFMKGTGTRLAREGFAVFGIDYEGHGKSSGLQAYIPCFDDLVKDCCNYFMSICEKEEYSGKLRILFGESMGGAVTLLLHRNKPDYWDCAVLVAPMCKIADDMTPHPFVISILDKLCNIIPTWKIIPTQDIFNFAIKEPEWREEVRLNPVMLQRKASLENWQRAPQGQLKLGTEPSPGDDKVMDPSVSKLLYESAASEDKTLKLYPGMWHTLTSWEPVENINLVFADIVSWLDHRTSAGAGTSSRWETEQKSRSDDPQIHALQQENA